MRYVMGEEDYGTMLRSVAGELGPLDVMMPAERLQRNAVARYRRAKKIVKEAIGR